MSIKRIVVDVPAEFHERFKISCTKNHTTIKDELTKLIHDSLDDVAVEDPDEKKGVDDDLDKPVYEKEDLKTKIEAELKAIREALLELREKLQTPSKNVDLTDHKTMHASGLSYCPTCAMDLRTGKDLKVLLAENSEKVTAELNKKAAENFTRNLRLLWNERKNLEAECWRCGFPSKREDPACIVCGFEKAKWRSNPEFREEFIDKEGNLLPNLRTKED